MFHSVVLSSEKKIFSCGLKKFAGLDLKDVTLAFEVSTHFELIPTLKNMFFKMISVGNFHNLALTEESDISSDVIGWGSATFGRLGAQEWSPEMEEEVNLNIKKIFAKKNLIHTCSL